MEIDICSLNKKSSNIFDNVFIYFGANGAYSGSNRCDYPCFHSAEENIWH